MYPKLSLGGFILGKNIQNSNLNNMKKLDKIGNEVGCAVLAPIFDGMIIKPFRYREQDKIYIDYINRIIDKTTQLLKKGGLLFVYGLPKWLPYFALNLNETSDMLFKYWIALDITNKKKDDGIDNNHIGMLMYVKGKNTPFHINTDTVRVPYVSCASCGKNIKDWGGKKHLINKNGSCISDVWKDFYKVTGEIEDPQIPGLKLQKIDVQTSFVNDIKVIPEQVMKRIVDLKENNSQIIHIICDNIDSSSNINYDIENNLDIKIKNHTSCDLPSDIYLGDSIEIMEQWVEKYPDGCFDLIFADPPYNLDKEYSNYNDKEIDLDYINWCNDWLKLCAKLLKPNGNLLVLNLPKWSVYHATLLNKELYFKDWIVWDALSNPRGKIMPAHYALLHYTKNISGIFNKDKLSIWLIHLIIV